MMNDLILEIRKFNSDRNWDGDHSPKNLAMSVVIEAAELSEHFQWLSETESYEIEYTQPVSDEVADVLIYLLNLCDKLHIDPYKAVKHKLEINGRRFAKPKGGMPCNTAAR
jgi:NTP pyrophosphatase (non-canonical NTP hydrolase)